MRNVHLQGNFPDSVTIEAACASPAEVMIMTMILMVMMNDDDTDL